MTWTALLSRLLIGIGFAVLGISKIMNFSGTVEFASATWLGGLSIVAVVVAIVVELLGGLLLIAGWQTKVTAWVMAIFLVIVTLTFHVGDTSKIMQMLIMTGGVLAFAHFGPGPVALDSEPRKTIVRPVAGVVSKPTAKPAVKKTVKKSAQKR